MADGGFGGQPRLAGRPLGGMNPPTSDTPYALVVDDDFIIRMDAIAILEQAGFNVMDAEHGDAAFDLLKTRHPDVVLLFTDVQMPGQLDGFALARKVAESWSHIFIVVASGKVAPEPGSMPDKATFIAKPFSAEVVHNHLQDVLPNGQKPEPLRRRIASSRRHEEAPPVTGRRRVDRPAG